MGCERRMTCKLEDSMTEAVIVSTARTPIGKAFRGALNNTEGPTMAGHVIGEAVRRAKVEPGEVEDVVMGCAMQQGTTAMNVARKARSAPDCRSPSPARRLIGNAPRACRRSRSPRVR